jgi:hypothetical protein
VLYALVCVYFIGLAWPYPVVLPDSFSFHDNTYQQQAVCRPLAFFARGVPRFHRVGSLPSALWWGERAIYSSALNPRFPDRYAWVVVQDNACYRFYGSGSEG